MWSTSDLKCAVSTDAIQRVGRGATAKPAAKKATAQSPIEAGERDADRAGQHRVAVEGALLRGLVAREWLDVLYACGRASRLPGWRWATRRQLYGALSAPAITITVASPARARLSSVTGSRWLIPTLRLTAFASAWCPGAYWTTDSASCWSEKSLIVPFLKPAAAIWSRSAAARPGTVVPLRTATVTLPGLTAAPLRFGLLGKPLPELSPPPVSCVTP